MADRNPSFFGPVLRQTSESAAFTDGELALIAARRRDLDAQRRGPSAWPAARRFETMQPPPGLTH